MSSRGTKRKLARVRARLRPLRLNEDGGTTLPRCWRTEAPRLVRIEDCDGELRFMLFQRGPSPRVAKRLRMAERRRNTKPFRIAIT